MEHIDAKTITAGGGILLAAFAMYLFYNFASNRSVQVEQALSKNSEAILKQSDAIQNLGEAIKQNTAIMNSLVSNRGTQILNYHP